MAHRRKPAPRPRASAFGRVWSARFPSLTLYRDSHPVKRRTQARRVRSSDDGVWDRERSGVSGWRLGRRGFRHTRLSTRCSTLYSALRHLYSVLCTLYSVLCTLYSASSGRADRPRSAAGMGSGFVSRSDDVPDLMPTYHAPADQQGRWSLPARAARRLTSRTSYPGRWRPRRGRR